MTDAMPDPLEGWAEIEWQTGLSQTDGVSDDVLCDMMVAQQVTDGHELDAPSAAAQKVLDDLREMTGDSYGEMWRAAVRRHRAASGGHVRDTSPQDASPKDDRLNDAFIHGKEPNNFADFLAREATFLTGEMWGQRDRRNTQDSDWPPVKMTWGQWINGGAATKNTAAWGFSCHPVGKDKAGACVVLGSSVGGARKAKAMDTMYAMGLDIDSGAKLDDVLDTLEEKGLFCLVYTSFNHGKTGIALKRDEVLRKLDITRDPTVEEVRGYLREHDKNRYEPDFIDGCTIADPRHQTAEGVKITLDTPPLEKFRLIFPLAEPVKLIDLADTQQAALDLWEDKITGLARNVLGVNFDTSCTDPSRLFFTARHPKSADDWYCAVVMGEPLAFDDVPAMSKAAYAANRDLNPFTQAGGADDRPPECVTPSGRSLNEWHRDAKERFMLADLLETLCPDKIRVAGGEAQGTVHTECPFEHEHNSEGGTGTMAVNAIDSQNGYWTWFCHHDACQGRHKLQFLEEALRAGWFDEEVLFDTSHSFLLEATDGEDDPFAPIEEVKAKARTFEDEAAAFDDDTTEREIRDLFTRAAKAGVDATRKGRLIALVGSQTALTKPESRKLWNEVGASEPKVRPQRNGIDIASDASDLAQYARDKIRAANAASPHFFLYMDKPTIVRNGRIRTLDEKGLSHELRRFCSFYKLKGDDGTQEVFPPKDLISDLYASDLTDVLLPLRGVATQPFFAADGSLVVENGYHAEAQVYLETALDLTIKDDPTEDDARASARYLVEEVFGDFPFGGLDRKELMANAFEGRGVPALANTLAMTLLPFCREMIDGPTPGHVVNKPSPATGAGYLVAASTIISTGEEVAASQMAANKQEFEKSLFADLLDAPPVLFYDNINHSMDSGPLASFMTAPKGGYSARVLGKSQTVKVPVRMALIFAANTLTMSGELLRRCILIDIDRRVPKPKDFVPLGGWRHENIKRWTDDNRAELVEHCLTVIRYWVNSGMKRSTHRLASFEDWAGVMGGILDACGVPGLMGNQDRLSGLSDDADDGLQDVMQAIADTLGGRVLNDKATVLFVNDKTDLANGNFGLFDILHGMDQTPELPGWGYHHLDNEPVYANTNKAGRRFKAAAQGVYAVTVGEQPYVMSFERDDRTKGYAVKCVSA